MSHIYPFKKKIIPTQKFNLHLYLSFVSINSEKSHENVALTFFIDIILTEKSFCIRFSKINGL